MRRCHHLLKIQEILAVCESWVVPICMHRKVISHAARLPGSDIFLPSSKRKKRRENLETNYVNHFKEKRMLRLTAGFVKVNKLTMS